MTARVRAARFVTVGLVGFLVQLTCVHLFATRLGVPDLVATALAVEAAILHNFVWHSLWTWRDRQTGPRHVWQRLARFNGVSAAVSIVGNVMVAAALRVFDVPLVAANAAAVVLMSAINYAGLDRWAFAVPVRRAVLAVTVVLVGVSGSRASAAELTPETLRAWQRYVASTEARIERELHATGRFLALDFDDSAERAAARAALRDGSVVVRNLGSRYEGDGIAIPDGTIHHWRGVVFVPGATVDEVLQAVADPTGARAHRQEDVIDARVISRSASGLRLFLKLQRRVIVSATYNTEHDVRYRVHGAGRASSRSVATRIVEVANAGEPDEYERPRGVDRGFLWGLNSYWRYEAVPGGVVVELESLTLSRGVPWGVGAVVRPLVDRVARESLTRTLVALRTRFADSSRRES